MSTFDRTRRVAWRSGAVAAGLWSATGCNAIRSRFASHEDVFPPIPLTIGEVRVTGTDTAYTLSGRGYEIVAPARDLLPDAQQALDDAARGFQRYLSAEPPRVVVDLRVRRDSANARAAQPRGRALGDTVAVALPRSREDRRAPREVTPRVGGFVTVPVVRAWLTSYAAASARPPAPSGAAPADPAEEPWGRDPRVPDWIEVALPPLVAGAPIADFAAVQLRRQTDALIPLRALFDSAHAGRGGGVPDAAEDAPIRRAAPGAAPEAPPAGRRRRAGKVDQAMLFDVQSIAVARFLAERAGPTILGDVVRTAMRGGRIDDVLRSAAGVPQNVDALDATWRAWLQEQRAGRRGGM
jgi:hypothetical protein